MDPLEIAQKLKQETDHLLYEQGMHNLLSHYGQVIYTGSYALDLMAWPDLDIYINCPPEKATENLADCLKAIVLTFPNYLRASLGQNLHLKRPQLPKGTFLGIKLDMGQWRLPFKLDIWVLDSELLEKQKILMNQFQTALTPEARHLILNMKHQFVTPEGRTASLSSYYLYEAVLFKQLSDEKDIRTYIEDRGITLPKQPGSVYSY